jgi:sigma-B regulation protein RsbU (phosphoserine phosphatase)
LTSDQRPQIRHELRTCLNHIVGYCEILREDAREYHRQDLLADIDSLLELSGELKMLTTRHFSKTKATPQPTVQELRHEFNRPLLQIITDARRLVALFRRLAPGFVRDMEQLLAVANEMYDLIETTLAEIVPLHLAMATNEFDPAVLPEHQITIPDFDSNEFSDTISGLRARLPGHILVIDDSSVSRDLLSRHLKALGHQVNCAANGPEAIAFLEQTPAIDVILLDVLIPGMSGIEILKKLRGNSQFQAIPVIMISALDNTPSIAYCIKLGAEDYLPKDFDVTILQARIDACLEKARLAKEQAIFVEALIASRETLAHELADAGRYVVSLLPKPVSSPFQASIALIPSAELGGDFCSYQQLDENFFSLYLLDVSGHGVKSALLAVSISNILKNQALPMANFKDPSSVLNALNRNFQAEAGTGIFFTIWYGVFNIITRELRFASGGAPPGCLQRAGHVNRLSTQGLLLGATSETEYHNQTVMILPHDRLFLFSDGIYETTRPSGHELGLEEFIGLLPNMTGNPANDVSSLVSTVLGLSGKDYFEDDVCVFEALF